MPFKYYAYAWYYKVEITFILQEFIFNCCKNLLKYYHYEGEEGKSCIQNRLKNIIHFCLLFHLWFDFSIPHTVKGSTEYR